MLEFGGMWSTPSLPSLPGLLWHGVVALDMFFTPTLADGFPLEFE